MQGYLAVISFCLLVILVIIRISQLKKLGIKAFKFGQMDKKDFILPPFVIIYFFILIKSALFEPFLGNLLFDNEILQWIGNLLSLIGILLFIWALISFKNSFRVGIDEDKPGELITGGVFSISRNPIYLAFIFVLTGIFLAVSDWILLIYVFAAICMLHRQILLEENSLKKIYGQKYIEYCKKVRRYF